MKTAIHKHDHTWNCVSNPVLPVSLSFCFSFPMAPESPEAGIWVSPQVRDSRTASWMNTYWSWVGQRVREVGVQSSHHNQDLCTLPLLDMRIRFVIMIHSHSLKSVSIRSPGTIAVNTVITLVTTVQCCQAVSFPDHSYPHSQIISILSINCWWYVQ